MKKWRSSPLFVNSSELVSEHKKDINTLIRLINLLENLSHPGIVQELHDLRATAKSQPQVELYMKPSEVK